jgi:hypothetical protein
MDITTLTPLSRLRAAYNTLEREVMRGLQIRMGDVQQLSLTRRRVLSFRDAAEQVRLYIDPLSKEPFNKGWL